MTQITLQNFVQVLKWIPGSYELVKAMSGAQLQPHSAAADSRPVSSASAAAAARQLTDDADASALSKQLRSDKTGETAKAFFAVPDGEMPLLVFVNPKSGGKQGGRLLDQFRKVLSETQVFDMMETDPKTGGVYGAKRGLELYGRVRHLCVLVCGGDGTVGWVLSTIEQLGLTGCEIKVGTIPLGTGNDLARSLKFGAGYSGQTALKLLAPLVDCASIRMDRWQLQCDVTDASKRKKNYNVELSMQPPQQFWNNYFSIGSDAHTALQFHLRREKNPKKFNSQWRNKMTYGIVGGFETLNTKFRKLSHELELVCDGVDYTAQLREKKIVALAFLNIHSYGAGTQPWGTKKAIDKDGFVPPRMDDGKLEVLGFWPWSFPKGQAGVGHAWRICQCSEAEINLLSPNPMQIDGEACFLAASKIRLRRHSQAVMLCHRQGRYSNLQPVISSGAPTPAEAAPEQCPVYEVSINPQNLTTSQLRRLGEIHGDSDTDMDTLTLSEIRTLVDTALSGFDTALKPATYSFLKFHKIDPDSEGKYMMIDSMSENSTLCRGFLFPVNGVRPGVFITQRVLGDEGGSTAQDHARSLLEAASGGDWRRAIGLMDSGVPPTVTDADGDTLVHLCAEQNMLELLTYLITHGVDCKRGNHLGDTPLHRASARGCTVACTMLLEADADVNARNNAGQSALDVAKGRGVLKLLADQGARLTAAAGAPGESRLTTPQVTVSGADDDDPSTLLNTSHV